MPIPDSEKDNTEPNINMANKCWFCIQEFKEDDFLVFRDGKIYHRHCIDQMDSEDDTKRYMKKYPYLTERQIDLIIRCEGIHSFNKITNNNWIILFESELEISISPYETQQEMIKAIERHYKEHEGNWDIDSIYHNGKRYHHSINVIVTLSLFK